MKKREVNLPEIISEDLAEIVGAFIGDGSLSSSHGYKIYIYGNLNKDMDYLNYLSNLFKRVFNLRPHLYFSVERNCAYIQMYSKKIITKVFNERFKFPLGKKIEVNIPQEIQENSSLLLACIRGIFDTDGCVSLQRWDKYEYPFISISTTSKPLSQTLNEQLNKFGFRSYVCIMKADNVRRKKSEYAVRMKGKEQLRLWFKLIASRNPRNLTKLESFVK